MVPRMRVHFGLKWDITITTTMQAMTSWYCYTSIVFKVICVLFTMLFSNRLSHMHGLFATLLWCIWSSVFQHLLLQCLKGCQTECAFVIRAHLMVQCTLSAHPILMPPAFIRHSQPFFCTVEQLTAPALPILPDALFCSLYYVLVNELAMLLYM